MPIEVPSPFLFVVTRGDSIGGAQIHVRDLARRWKALGAEVHVAVGSRGPLTEQLQEAGVAWHLVEGLQRSINPLRDMGAVWRLRRLIRKLRPKLVSAHTAKAGLAARLAAAISGVPCKTVFTAHGWQFADGISLLQKLVVLGAEKIAAPLSHRIITVSDYDFQLAERYGISRPPRLVRVHNGMPDRPAPSRVSWEGQRELRLIMIARLQDQKDHETLFRALAGWEPEGWRLQLVGDGPKRAELEKLAAQLGLSDKVDFLGQRMDAPELLDRADLYLLISHWEGFPRSILEAMRSGLPVIASDVGGSSESVAEGETGFLVRRGDSQSVLAALNRYREQPGLLALHGAAGRKRFELHFTFAAMEKATLRAYQ